MNSAPNPIPWSTVQTSRIEISIGHLLTPSGVKNHEFVAVGIDVDQTPS
jgi:hypothetical protein